MANIQNGRCWAQVDPDEPPLIQHGRIVMQGVVLSSRVRVPPYSPHPRRLCASSACGAFRAARPRNRLTASRLDRVDHLGLPCAGSGRRLVLADRPAPALVYERTSPAALFCARRTADACHGRNASSDVRHANQANRPPLPSTAHRPFLSVPADIVRILFMVPIYAVISFASYLWWVSDRPRLCLPAALPSV